LTSILTDIKKLLGLPAEHEEFDTDVIIHINTALFSLHQLGVGPPMGLRIEGKEDEWSAFLEDDGARREAAKTYIYLKVKSYFDQPGASFHTTALKEQIQELEWRLNAAREETEWLDYNPLPRSSLLSD